jgi:hypothetical protein
MMDIEAGAFASANGDQTRIAAIGTRNASLWGERRIEPMNRGGFFMEGVN